MVFGISKENPKALSRKLFCAISECRPTSDKENNVSLFKVSASKAQEWSLAVGFQLKTNQKICSLHFQEEDIIKGKIILNTFHPHRWLLRKGAVPIFNHRQSSGISIHCIWYSQHNKMLFSSYSKTAHEGVKLQKYVFTNYLCTSLKNDNMYFGILLQVILNKNLKLHVPAIYHF